MGVQHSVSDYDKLVSLVYQGAREQKPWLGFVDSLSAMLDARDATLFMYSKRNCNCHYFVTSDRAPHLDNALHINEVLKLNFSLEDAPAKEPTTLREVTRHLGLRQNPLIQKYLRPIEVKDVLYQDVYHDEDLVIRIALGRTRHQGEFENAERDMLSLITPHLRTALDLRNSYEESSTLAAQAMDLLGKMSIGTVVVDANKNVIAANQAAISALSKNFGITMKEGKLHLANGNTTSKFRNALDMMIAAHQRGITFQKGMAIGLESQDGLPGLDVVIKPLFLSNMPSAKLRPAALILVNDCESGSIDVEAKMLREAYNLTDREAKLVSLLGQGYTLNEAAKELQVSINTIKKHLKGTYEKLGKHRRSQVVAMLSRCTAKFI